MKKKILIVLAAYVVYCLGGVGLIALGYADRWYFMPYWSIKGPNSDKSGLSADGPWIAYAGPGGVLRQVEQQDKDLFIRQDTLPTLAGQQIRCFVATTGRDFSIPLREPAQPEPAIYAEPDRTLVLSDIEGNFAGLEALLRGSRVVDKNLNWSFGNGHLVLLGDFFDRGLQVTECLWLVYKLEHEAARAGGKVHFILGNHERMNLTGHFKYVRRKYRVNADTLQWPYEQWYGPQTVLGQWLRSKNVVEKIGSSLLTHGGLSTEVAALRLPLVQLNAEARAYLQRAATDTMLTSTQRLVNMPPLSPDWYRGVAQEEVSAADLTAMLKQYEVNRLIIGHTPVTEITALYGGKVLAIDLPHQERTDGKQPLQALLLEQGQPIIIDSEGRRTAQVSP
ncbi:metallophosphoesterase [Hymenobacter psychrophilus]|uniref:Calcineurin-like phosphoesterase n=1 Tax=Hymenobacter psychrophilus TaxID=651662 RepID=A0A1H3PB75_9BACT|nr:metallophosphoesterase [Hymenobacter psychrophilus]SDY98384.1 Calcineurin-like phosphoesterase [Hymenobacter psychrophilus]